jgi:SAM-dependent methyltransferase
MPDDRLRQPSDQLSFMTAPRQEPAELEQIYDRRFGAHLAYRNEVWKVLISKFFSPYIEPHSTALDLGCGYGEFINNIQCAQKYAMDLNAKAGQFLARDVCFLQQDCSEQWNLPGDCLDLVFTSNFFEHLVSRRALTETLAQAKRCLRAGGRIIAMGPNIRYVGGAYWDFSDHHIALTDRSLKEALEIQGFEVERAIDRFLPYTMVNRRRYPRLFVSVYLGIPLAWRFFGKQFLLIASKP